jgi:hypothetical protein
VTEYEMGMTTMTSYLPPLPRTFHNIFDASSRLNLGLFYSTTTEGKEANMWLIASLICSIGGAGAAPPLFSDNNQSFSDAIGVGYVTLG